MLSSFTSKGSDSKYFSTQKKGEIHELRNDLNSLNKDKVKEAVKKVIASMTVGKDVSSLFTDVIKRMQTDNIELKKLVYLYIINYARSQPDKAILVVNTFQKDAQDPNPLIRALAIRTMGCIRVDRITQFLCDPLQMCLKDKDPYVRKTAAVCVAKLYDVNPELVEEQGLLDTLRDMISDSNHTVVANAVAALLEIGDVSGKDVFHMNPDTLSRLLTALNACTEWGQVSILECLGKYTPTAQEAEDVVERVAPRLKHANCAVSMAAVKVLMHYVSFIENEDIVNVLLTQKLPPPLITLLSDRRPEIQYVALRNISLIVQRYPTILASHVKHFFCKYNDPIYVKLEKLEIMVALINNDNLDKVLLEFKEYASEADVDFVRKAVRAIGRCAIKLNDSADKCISILLKLIENKVNYVVQESIIVIKNIFRRYPNEYESIISTLCENLDTLDEPEAKAAMIWIIGEYCERIDNAAELLGTWLESFLDETTTVQLQLLTAIVKLFLKVPAEGKDLVTNVLTLATKSVDNPDLRDRGFIYWRLLSENPDVALKVVLAAKPQIGDDTTAIDSNVLDVLIKNMSTLASVYHKVPESFVKSSLPIGARSAEDDEEDDAEIVDSNYVEEAEAHAAPAAAVHQAAPAAAPVAASSHAPIELDLLGLSLDTPAPAAAAPAAAPVAAPVTDIFDIFGLGAAPAAAPAPVAAPEPLLIPAEKGSGVEVRGRATRVNNQLALTFTFTNNSAMAYTSIPVKFNANYLNLAPKGVISLNLPAHGTATATLPLVYSKPALDDTAKAKSGTVQVAMKLAQVAYFAVEVDYSLCFEAEGLLQKQEWLQQWQQLGEGNTAHVAAFHSASYGSDAAITARLAQYNMVHLATRNIPNSGCHMFFSAKWRNVDTLVEVITNNGNIALQVKSVDVAHAQVAAKSIETLLR